MLFKSQVYTQASGSIGGLTYSHNASGMYTRARSIPVNPSTGFQQTVRSGLADLVTRWTSVLTAAQRAAWNLYAASVPVTNALGDQVYRSGQNWYIACNSVRYQLSQKLYAGLGGWEVDDAPTTFDRGDFTTTVATLSEASGLSLAYTNGDDWASEVGSYLLVFQGKPTNPSRNFFKGPWRLIGTVPGAATPPTSPLTVSAANLASLGFVITEGQNVSIATAVTRIDGRLTTRRVQGPIAVAA